MINDQFYWLLFNGVCQLSGLCANRDLSGLRHED